MPVSLSDRNVIDVKDGHLECVSYQDRRFNIKLLQRDCGVQAIPIVQSSSAQTLWYEYSANEDMHNLHPWSSLVILLLTQITT